MLTAQQQILADLLNKAFELFPLEEAIVYLRKGEGDFEMALDRIGDELVLPPFELIRTSSHPDRKCLIERLQRSDKGQSDQLAAVSLPDGSVIATEIDTQPQIVFVQQEMVSGIFSGLCVPFDLPEAGAGYLELWAGLSMHEFDENDVQTVHAVLSATADRLSSASGSSRPVD